MASDPLSPEPGVLPYTYWSFDHGQIEPVQGGLIEEILLSMYVNGQDLATVMCTPLDQEALAVGFLFTEGVIESLDEVGLVRANAVRTTVDVFLRRASYSPPRRLTLTSGCGGGITLRDLAATYPDVDSPLIVSPQVILDRMRDLNHAARLYQQVRGVHTSLLGDEQGPLISAEDIGRHNTIDKVAGKALLAGIALRDRVLLTSGRISSEMLGKARQMGVPVVASRTAPTSITVSLAQAWRICVIGYVRQGAMRIYTHPWRLGLPGKMD